MMQDPIAKSGLIDTGQVGLALEQLAGEAGNKPQLLRSKVLALLKQVSAQGREKARRQLEANGRGGLCAANISLLQDELIRLIYNFAVSHVYKLVNPSLGERICVVAVGGYGRGKLAPGSDIDLLFVLPYKQTAWGEAVVEFVLYMLWDMGFKVGHATRNVDECIRQSKADMTIRTSILEARHVWGTALLFDELSARFRKDVIAGSASEFIAAKLAERDERHKRTGNSRYLVEPNVKDGKGGLRDLHTLFWIGKYFYQAEHPADLVAAGLFTQSEFQRFRRAEEFLWTVRCHMHFLAGKAEERLSFEIQRDLATRLKYASHGGLQDVERFMKHYFLVAKEVGDLTLIVCATLEEQDAKSVQGITGLIRSIRHRVRKIPGTLDFINDNGRINIANIGVFERDPVNMIRLFKLADDNDLNFHPDALHLITKSMKLADRKLRASDEANRLFLDILTTRNGPENLLRRMNESGLLGKFIPEFGKIVAMMQFSMYHHYTVDEHLIRAVGMMHALESGELAQDHPLSQGILPAINDRQVLYVALLIHDIAKGGKEDHSLAGARIARQLCPRLGMSEAQTEFVSWLVNEHLTMSMVAQSRDLSDRRTILGFAETVQTVERMRYLLLLTICDIRAVGPGVWNGWKGQLLRTLYYETEPLLTGGFSTVDHKARVAAARQALSAALDGWSAQDRKAYTSLPYPAYFMATDFETQIRHMNFVREADRTGQKHATSVHTRKFEAITEITVLTPDHPRLLSVITGSCAAAGANIADAKIHTTSDGRALDSIFINREFEKKDDELRRASRIGRMIEDVLAGAAHLPEMIANKARQRRQNKAFAIKPSVMINNDLSDEFSVIEVEGLDRLGLLSELTRTLADLDLNIGSAHIATFGERVIDVFYVRDLVGDKLTSDGRKTRVAGALMAVFDPGAVQTDNPWRHDARRNA